MSKRHEIRAVGAPLSAVLDLCKRAADRCRRLADRIADQFRVARRENKIEVARVMKVSHPLQADFTGKPLDLTEFMKTLSIGDRVRLFCDDGVVVAEKISQTQFREINAETMSELVH